MKIGFIYNRECDLAAILQQPLDDAAAAVTYLAIQLAKLGHQITIFSQSPNMPDVYNVRFRNMSIKDNALAFDPAILENDFSALIVKNDSIEFAIAIKNALPYKPEIYIWTALDHNQPVNKGLNKPELLAQITGVVCVSEWQRHRFVDNFPVNRDFVTVAEYAISPFFEDLFIDGKELVATKSQAPLLAFTSIAQDGLEILIDVFPDITNNYPQIGLSLFCNMHFGVETPGPDRNKYEGLLNTANHTKGIKYLGDLPKVQLAAQLRTHSILAYPATIEQTSNVAILEAMAAGLYVVTSRIGANEDYCQEHGKIIAPELLRNDSLDSFISETLTICQTQIHSGAAFYDYCYKQTAEINKKFTWRVRAREWLRLLEPQPATPAAPAQ